MSKVNVIPLQFCVLLFIGFANSPILVILICFAQSCSLLTDWIRNIKNKLENLKNFEEIEKLHRLGLKALNDTFSSFFFFMITFGLIAMITTFYWTTTIIFKPDIEIMNKILIGLGALMIFFIFFDIVIYVNCMSQIVTDEVQKLKETLLIYKGEVSNDEKFEALYLIDSFHGFDANGYFVLGKPLLTSVAANFTTFIIVLIQFRLSEKA